LTPVIAFQEHDSLLESWCARGFWHQRIICFDRHLDVKRISSSQIDRLMNAPLQPAQVRALRRDLPFRDDDSCAYGFDNFVFAAHALGYVSHFVWICPEPIPLSLSQLARILWQEVSLFPNCPNAIAPTFVVDGHSVRCSMGTLTIELTTVRRLHHLQSTAVSHVDVDLDYFCDSLGVFEHNVTDVVTQLRRAKIVDQVETLSYSLFSGFLPESARGVGHELCDALGRTLSLSEDSRQTAQESMAALASNKRISPSDLEGFWRTELSSLGGPGFALRAVLESRLNNIESASEAYASAREAGDRAKWAAYAIGLRLLARAEYENARLWFEEVLKPELVDSMQSHAALLHLLCLCRLRRYDEAVFNAQSLVIRLPMRAEGYTLGLWAARQLNHRGTVLALQEKEKALRSTWSALMAVQTATH
jgi:hypothetical protein